MLNNKIINNPILYCTIHKKFSYNANITVIECLRLRLVQRPYPHYNLNTIVTEDNTKLLNKFNYARKNLTNFSIYNQNVR